ncbi:hypothetical protein BJX62DRAFT_87945 [Aspergillus germanicus]
MLPSEVQVEAVCPAQLRNVRKEDRSKSRVTFRITRETRDKEQRDRSSCQQGFGASDWTVLSIQKGPGNQGFDHGNRVWRLTTRWMAIHRYGKMYRCKVSVDATLIIRAFPGPPAYHHAVSLHRAHLRQSQSSLGFFFFLQRLLQAVGSKLSLSPLHLISQTKSISKVSGMPVDIHPPHPSLPSLTGDCDSLNRPSGEFRRSAEGWMRVPILPRVSLDEGMHDWRGMQVALDSKKGAKAR